MQPNTPRQAAKPAPLRAKQWPANRYFVSRQHRLLYCPIQKVACTSLKVWWAESVQGTGACRGIENKKLHAHLQSQFSYSEHALELGDEPLEDPDWFRFAFVRNPWARLVSAFLNKFVHWSELAPKIVNELRRGLARRLLRQPISGQAPEDRLAPWWLFRSAASWSEQLTFRQFVNHLAACDMSTVNGHWRPQSHFLGQVEFHFIGRFEHLARDVAELNRRLGREQAVPRINSTEYAVDESSPECVADWPLCRLRKLPAAPHYLRFYTPALAQTVGRLYADDVERFGYEFGRETDTGRPVDNAFPAHRNRLANAA
jgi:hypothetical protein